jgi:hypothetical protein
MAGTGGAVTRRSFAPAAVLWLALAACGAPSPPAVSNEERAAAMPAASICFRTAALGPPPAEVHALVAEVTRGLAEPRRAWIRSLITHESAGVADAISPTGCAGLLAIQSCRGCTPCCIADPEDPSPRFYDRCGSEERSGWRCDPARDPRFRPAFALAYAERRIAALERRLARDRVPETRFAVALATSWNAGSGIFVDYPRGLDSATAALERLDFGTAEPYRSWTPEDRWNKVVEIHDYVLWLEHLAAYWRGDGARTVEPAAPMEICFAVATGRLTRAARSPEEYRPVEIRRLRFGRYVPDVVEVLVAPED